MRILLLSFFLIALPISRSLCLQTFQSHNPKSPILLPFVENSRTLPNSLQLDLGGPGLIYSLNYERFILQGNRFSTALRIGAAWYPPTTNYIGLWIPFSVNELISFGSHHLEVGVGYVYTNDLYTKTNPLPGITELYNFLTFHMGYRYQVPGDRFIFRVGFSPLIEHEVFINEVPVNRQRIFSHLRTFHPSAVITFGYRF